MVVEIAFFVLSIPLIFLHKIMFYLSFLLLILEIDESEA